MSFRITKNTKSYILGNYTGDTNSSIVGTNIGVSPNPLKFLDGGQFNTNIGVGTEYSITNNSETTLVGYASSGRDLSVVVGAYSYTNGFGNTFIGTSVQDSNSGVGNNQTVIGFNSESAGTSHSIRLGNADITLLECEVGLTATSDIRIKKNIQDNKLGLEFISRLRPVRYQKVNPKDYPKELLEKRFTRDKNKADRPEDDLQVYDGLIAQEVEQTLKDLDIQWSGHHINPANSKQSLDYATLTIPLINSIKTLKSQIEQLTQRIEQLEN
jgi:hypothetical protein